MTIEALVQAVQTALDETEREYAQMPFFIRPMIRRGFVKRTGQDFAGWRELLRMPDARLKAALPALAEHYRGAPQRARRGMGATAAQLEIVEARSKQRAEAVAALAAALST
ncbi:MAG TPA: hypothetical protein VLB44_08530 [Kofleriaceae bacterium]|nr:hypothetical protein [Kofleriaceae bacterium]